MPATISGSQTGTVGLINTFTAINSTSGTSINFTGIPSGVRRVTVLFNGVSTNGTSIPQIQIGSGSFTTSGYLGSASGIVGSVASTNYASGALLINNMVATIVMHGAVRITNISSNSWVFDGVLGRSDSSATSVTGGSVALSGTLDRVRITTVGGTDAFDAGSINVLYE
jgi:hypothetical protein